MVRDKTAALRRGCLPVLGIDVGGVIVDRVAENTDTSFFGGDPMNTPAVPDAFRSIAALCADPFEYRAYIISKAGQQIAATTRRWLGDTHFFAETGMNQHNLHFVRRRPDKAPLCARFGITHFVDDRLDVLQHLTTVEHRYLFTGGLGANDVPEIVPGWAIKTPTWPLLAERIRMSVG